MQSRDPGEYIRNLALAGIAGQSGCVSSAFVIAALIIGLWLDKQLGTEPILTIFLMVLSVPVSLYIMVRIVLGSVRRITPPVPKHSKSKQYDDSE